jgi:rhodanese-related sulfurtransferase
MSGADRMRTPLRAIFVVGLLAGAAVLASCGSTAKAVIETVSPADAEAVLADNDDAVLLDIRTPEEYAEARISGSENIDFYDADFAAQLEQLDPDGTYVVYCRSDNRSGQAMETFRDLGFSEVYEMDGGIVNWYESGYPVES